ncbi:hypothetical protein CPT_Moabite_151 [Serratia phage Moabite]|uniref:Uncharacterized protein n=3 Tax=Moabitevirus TaxID=2843422 RepID=A0A7T3NBJ1_9CAUD|nr:hypothetical protein HWB23_gp067 [Serratia phage vB_SmaM_ 2050HW]YP_009849245.1 hypothetical protein HWC48_gp265 [Serratia phage Moabite]QPX76673.1 hypothetical protein [Serratia phage vB_SmaM_Yaphecito]UCR74681.1 hypothetical protein [Serratia phage BUCT660]UGO54036.1 hypothetical protein HAYMO_54 [Serratia phage vB_SmaM_Haymo]URG14249.1 hypothetical protein [Pectobacterium phage vB_ParM-25]ATA65402.1 hypothetical protein 2050HW_00067 [Serratia phage vB_SmaM_ 2050HW]
MRSIKQLEPLLRTYGKVDRGGATSVQHQTFFVRPAPLNSEIDISENLSDFTTHQMDGWRNLESFQDMIDVIAKTYGDNVASKVPAVPMSNLSEVYDRFLAESGLRMVPIFGFSMEIRDAQPFSQNLFHFIEGIPPEVSEKLLNDVRAKLAEVDLPGEMVNLNFMVQESCTVMELYRMMTFITVLLKESAKETHFLPGRAVGTFAYISAE